MNSQKSVVKQSRVSQLKGQTEIKRRWKEKERERAREREREREKERENRTERNLWQG